MSTDQMHQQLDPATANFYKRTLKVLLDAHIPFLVGGAYAFEHYTGIVRHTKDLDVLVVPRDAQHTLDVLSQAGYETEMTYPQWLGKAFQGDDFVDVIFRSSNELAEVGQGWFEHAVDKVMHGLPVKLCPPEELLWTKVFIMERERYDGADVAHLLLAMSDRLDWRRFLSYFDEHWRVLVSHLILFGYIYPGERTRIPAWVMEELLRRLEQELDSPPSTPCICHGTFLSHTQYQVDVEQWGFQNARDELS